MKTWKWKTSSSQKGRADQLIIRALKEDQGQWETLPEEGWALSRSQLQKLMEEQLVFIEGKPCTPSDSLAPGVTVTLLLPDPVILDLTPDPTPLAILYEDDDLAIINKPRGLSVHPVEGQQPQPTLVQRLLGNMDSLSSIGGVARPGIVHRLDKDTSGLIMVSKNDKSHHTLSQAFSDHTIHRNYLALCYGVPKEETFKIESHLDRSPHDRKKQATVKKGGRFAVSHFHLLEHYPGASLIQAKLETGRTHQIRVHLHEKGHSLLGDPLYGVPKKSQSKLKQLSKSVQNLIYPPQGQLLHSYSLKFKHPSSGQELSFIAPTPKDFEDIRALLSDGKIRKINLFDFA